MRFLKWLASQWHWLLLLALTAGVAVYFVYFRQPAEAQPVGKKGGRDSASRVMPVVAQPATKKDINVYLTGLGTVTPLKTVTVRSRVDGQLMRVLFREGQLVREGELLAEIDPRPFQAALTQAEGQMERDQALLANARIDLDRYRTLLAQDSIAKQLVDTQEALVRQYMIISLTSDKLDRGQMYDAASTILAQKLSQVPGIGQVTVGGSSLPAVRVELNPTALNKYAIGLDEVRTAINATNANRPKGTVEDGDRQWQIYANDQAKKASDYLPVIVAYRNGAAVRLADVGDVVDSVQDLRNAGISNGKSAVLVILYRQPGANIIEVADRVREVLPQLAASIPQAIDVKVVLERTTTIRASLRDVEQTLILSMVLVILVVFMMPFFLTMPIKRMIPISAITSISWPNSNNASRAPTPADGSVDRMVIG